MVRDTLIKISLPVFIFIEEIGIMITSIIAVVVLIILVKVLLHLSKNNKTVRKILLDLKAKLMWSSILRYILHSYFISVYLALSFLNKIIERTSNETVLALAQTKLYFTLFLAVAFPTIPTVWLVYNKIKLIDETFLKSYGSLY